MSKKLRRAIVVLAVLLSTATAACSLVEEATTFTFCSDPSEFVFDSDSLGVSGSGQTIPVVTCEGPEECGVAGVGLGCGSGTPQCSVECSQHDSQQQCDVVVVAESSVTVNITDKVQNQTQASVLSKVTVSRVEIAVSENTLNFDTPKATVFVGPNSAQSPSDASVVQLAQIDPIAQGTTFDTRALPTTEAGQQRLAELVRDYKTPFRLFVRMESRFVGGQAFPDGRLRLSFGLCFKASVL